MPISYPLSLPANNAMAAITLSMIDAVSLSESPFSFSPQTYEHQGKRWMAQVAIRKLQRADAEEWIGGFLAALNGRKGTFLMGDPAGATGRGTLTGSPLVNGASQVGQVLNIDGATINITGWIKKGDYVQLGSGSSARLHKSMSDANSNGSGQVVLDLWPGIPVGQAPADNAPLVVSSAVGLFRLGSSRRDFSISEAIKYGIEFAALSDP